MDKNLELRLHALFSRTLGPIKARIEERIEEDIELDRKPRRADIREIELKSRSFTLFSRTVVVHGSFFKAEEVFRTYMLSGEKIPPFSLSEVLNLLKSLGYRIPEKLYDDEGFEKDYDEEIVRDERGVKNFFSSLRSFNIKAARLTLTYDRYYLLSFSFTSDQDIDLFPYERIDLGLIDSTKELPRIKKDALIKYLKLCSNLTLHAGLNIVNIVDYMSILEAIKVRSKRGPFEITITKEISEGAKSHRFIGGENYKDFGIELSPLDFAYYIDGFKDTEEERRTFFSYLDGKGRGNNKKEISYYLSILGLEKGATKEEIVRKYRERVKALHPDKLSSLGLDPVFSDFATREMEKINEAYSYLKEALDF